MDFSLDGLADFLSGVINSVTGTAGDLFGAVDSFIGTLDFTGDSDSGTDFISDSLTGAKNLFFGDAGMPSMRMESEDGINATLSGEPASKGLIGQVAGWAESNPTSAKLASGLIAGTAQGYMQNRQLEQQEKLFDKRIAAEEKQLRDRYKYDSEAVAENRRQKQNDAFGVYMKR